MMLDAFAKWARERTMPYIMLFVAVENDVARHLYEKHGFRSMMLSQRKLLESQSSGVMSQNAASGQRCVLKEVRAEQQMP
jgi:hypothetical protein